MSHPGPCQSLHGICILSPSACGLTSSHLEPCYGLATSPGSFQVPGSWNIADNLQLLSPFFCPVVQIHIKAEHQSKSTDSIPLKLTDFDAKQCLLMSPGLKKGASITNQRLVKPVKTRKTCFLFKIFHTWSVICRKCGFAFHAFFAFKLTCSQLYQP